MQFENLVILIKTTYYNAFKMILAVKITVELKPRTGVVASKNIFCN
jgi:hypothetical protein